MERPSPSAGARRTASRKKKRRAPTRGEKVEKSGRKRQRNTYQNRPLSVSLRILSTALCVARRSAVLVRRAARRLGAGACTPLAFGAGASAASEVFRSLIVEDMVVAGEEEAGEEGSALTEAELEAEVVIAVAEAIGAVKKSKNQKVVVVVCRREGEGLAEGLAKGREGTGVAARTPAGGQGYAMRTEFLRRERHRRRRTGWGRQAEDGHGGADAGGATGAGDADAVVGEGDTWRGKVRRSSARGKPTAGGRSGQEG
jgi:hypothetical protein